MRLRLSYHRPGERSAEDLLVTVDTTVTVSSLAETIRCSDPQASPADLADHRSYTLRIDDADRSRVVPATATVAEAGLRSGQTFSLVADDGRFSAATQLEDAAAMLIVVSGPEAGRQFPLRWGSNQIGRERDNDVCVSDPMVSKHHARINIGETIEIIDLGSSNGVIIGDAPSTRAVLQRGDTALLGETGIQVQPRGMQQGTELGAAEAFNRSPRLDPVYPGIEVTLPQPPSPPQLNKMSFIPLLAPVLIGGAMFAVTRSLISILFIASSPLLMLGNLFEGRISGRRAYKDAALAWRADLLARRDEMNEAQRQEMVARNQENLTGEEVATAAVRRDSLLWSRRPERRAFLELRVGRGRMPSRSKVALPPQRDGLPALLEELDRLRADFASVPQVPVTVPLNEVGSLGFAGPRVTAVSLVRSALVQLSGLHSPADLVLCAVAPSAGAADWSWMKWLPQVNSDYSPFRMPHLGATPASVSALVAALEDLIEERTNPEDRQDTNAAPAVVLLVDDGAPVERGRLVRLAEEGRPCNVFVLWCASRLEALPAACAMYVDASGVDGGNVVVGQMSDDTATFAVPDRVSAATAEQFARSLAPLVDSGAPADDASDLPTSISLVALLGSDVAASADAVLDRWRVSNSLPQPEGKRKSRKPANLRALVGVAADQNLVLDLREHGPHALVGGTTGAGKSEFLQSWVIGMAVEHSPSQVNFLFVDYKGGSAFGECIALPHAVGLVTDLSPHLVRRVLTSLHAELVRREKLLRSKAAKDLVELERTGDPETPPSLVIVVDEFAALVNDIPEFVDGMVNVAQRGRSLGLHLVLATQRPAGVIKDNLRANTNLRIALRMADESDSSDVVGSSIAGGFDPATPGRAVAKLGPGRLRPFQSGYAGGWTSDAPPPPVIAVEPLRFGPADAWEDPRAEERVASRPEGPNDLRRLVSLTQEAHRRAELPRPRRPWLDTLAPVYDLAKLRQSRTDDTLYFGVVDLPARQEQVEVAFRADVDGNMAVYGTGGSGKSLLLRTLGVLAGVSRRGGPCHVYGLDFSGRGLSMLRPLPHVGAIIQGEDDERVRRLLTWLRELIDERSARFAKVNAGSLTDYRQLADDHLEARILVLVDGMGAFRQQYEATDRARLFEMFQGIAADGRQVGIHVVVTADRAAAIPGALNSVIQRRLVLRMANDDDYAILGVPTDVLSSQAPAGRGLWDGEAVHVGVLGGNPSVSLQAAAISQLADDLERSWSGPRPHDIRRLPDRIALQELPLEIAGTPAFCIADDSLAPVEFARTGAWLVVGPSQSGKSSALAALAMAYHRWQPGVPVFVGAASNSMLTTLLPWAVCPRNVTELVQLLTPLSQQLTAAPGEGRALIVIDDIPNLVGSEAEGPLTELVKSAKSGRLLLAASGETGGMSAYAPLLSELKALRQGLALQPDQTDGDAYFKTPFPRVRRADLPPGRGFLVRGGRARLVQCATPEGG